ncbi:MAG: DUF2284 domain-containing protein [Phascolarctobacterium sp.]|nr:DUF2284 domain-containing protein [Phascolarctobacterium sp.]
MEKYIEFAKSIGFVNAKVLSVKQLVYVPEYRKYCEENLCGNYDKVLACPPKCGTVEEMHSSMQKYQTALILQTELKLPAFDQAKYLAAKREHNILAEKIMQQMEKDGTSDYLFMAAGPWKNHSCLSAYCVDAQKMADACGLICWGNDGTIRLFSLILTK